MTIERKCEMRYSFDNEYASYVLLLNISLFDHLKLTKRPCAVSGLRYPTEVPSGPMVVLNMRLNGKGWVILFSGLLGDFTEYFFSISCSSSAENASACR